MNILFIYSLEDVNSRSKPLQFWSQIQFGISYISAVLKIHHYQTRLVVLRSNKEKESVRVLRAVLQEFNPQLVCFTAVFSQYGFIKKMAEFTKKQLPGIFSIIGGAHATLNPDEVIEGPFDALCIGEGEYPTLELCEQLSAKKHPPSKIANLWIKTLDGEIEKNVPREFIQDIDSLPLPDRDMWEPWVEQKINGLLSILLGRGCHYDCTYCSNHAFRKTAHGKYVRLRSLKNIIEELDFLNKKYPHRYIHFELETIGMDRKWAIEFCHNLKAFNKTIGNTVLYECNYRIQSNRADEELFSVLKEADIYKIHIGLESGSERIRREVMKRSYTNEDFINTVQAARKHGLKICIFNLIGIPGESPDDHKETVRMNRECQPEGHFTSIVCPYPGTELYERCMEKGLIATTHDAVKTERRQAVLDLPDFSKKQIQRAYVWFDYHVYKGHKPRLIILMRVLSVKIRSNPSFNFIYDTFAKWPLLKRMRARLNKMIK